MPQSTAIRNLSGIASSITSLGKPSTPTIRGVETSDLFGPLQPFLPIAPPGTEARGFQYWPGQNLVTPPRPDAELNAARLKLLSQYPVARICIENVKDVITDMPRQVQIRAMPCPKFVEVLSDGHQCRIALIILRIDVRFDR